MVTLSKDVSRTDGSAGGNGYMSGFGNEHSCEALPNALPVGRFSPQKCAYGLYAEKLSSTAFTVPRAQSRRTWLYRIRPSVVQGEFRQLDHALFRVRRWVAASRFPTSCAGIRFQSRSHRAISLTGWSRWPLMATC